MNQRYEPSRLEPKWQRKWNEAKVFKVSEDKSRPKYYLLEMFPYPSGRIHMGHLRVYTIGDVVARYKRMRGFNVLHPMGWDAFGMPAENAAIAAEVHPAKWTYGNIDNMRAQLKKVGYSYDWDRELATCDPAYYKWEQLIFLKLLERNQAYRRKTLVNYCPTCQTVLANEQVEQGLCWRCANEVVQQEQWGWFLKITDYAEELLDYTYKLPGWPERVLTMQQNWIGRSEGATIRFPLENPPAGYDDAIEVFTTRQDTVFGATFMSLAPEHPLVEALSQGSGQAEAVAQFVDKVKRQNVIQRTAEGYEKEGVFTGGYCRHPMTGARIPIFAANFVLLEYGTGAVMAVPAHDQRDYDFAVKYDLPIVEVVRPEDESLSMEATGAAYVGPGRMVNSGQFDGLENERAKKDIAAHLEARGLGGLTVTYRLRDWGVSRQRYWGAPIPVVYCDKCGVVPVPETDLPVVLPEEVEITGSGRSPLERVASFVETTCPGCGGPARRETDTMDTFVESSWYFDRYCSPDYDRGVFDRAKVDYWMPVDQYIGGIEHAILHLLYSRYWTKVLRDLGYLQADEPFTRLLTQGMVVRNLWACPVHGPVRADKIVPSENEQPPTCRLCGSTLSLTGPKEKMSKSKGNTLDPEELVDKYGADTVRLFYLFASPPEKDMEWSDEGIQGAQRFLGRIWRLVVDNLDQLNRAADLNDPARLDGRLKELWRKVNATVKKVTDEIEERWHFNTAVAAIMELVNEAYLALADEAAGREPLFWPLLRRLCQTTVLLLAPLAPHLADELHHRLGGRGFLIEAAWPGFDHAALAAEEVTVVLQVNGKLRGQISVPVKAGREELERLALAHERIRKYVGDKPVRKVIVVPGKLVNVVV